MTRPSHRLALTVVLSWMMTGCSSLPGTPGGSDADGLVVSRAIVEEVVDGDTVRIRVDGDVESVRLLGIDTPETRHPTKPVECFGPQASAALGALLPEGMQVRIERDIESRDAYGRLLLYVFVVGPTSEVFVNLALVRHGFARSLIIEPNVRYAESLVNAAFDAQRNDRGLWRYCK